MNIIMIITIYIYIYTPGPRQVPPRGLYGAFRGLGLRV